MLKLILLPRLASDQVAIFCYHYEGYFRKTSLFTPSGGHNFRCRGQIGTGSGSYNPPCPYVPAHNFSALGVESFKKKGVGSQFLGTNIFHFLPLPGNITSGVGVGSGPGLVYTNCHCCIYLHTEFQTWGLSPSKKGGVAIFGNENFYYFSSFGNKNWILFEPDHN